MSSIIVGNGMHAFGEDALEIFLQMQKTDLIPNHFTFVCILSACNHAGLWDEDKQIFHSMVQDYDIILSVEHYLRVSSQLPNIYPLFIVSVQKTSEQNPTKNLIF